MAVALNALALAAFGDVVSQWRQAGSAHPKVSAWITAVMLPAQKPPADAEGRGPQRQALEKANRTRESTLMTTAAPATVLQSSRESPDAAARFYRTGEVDRPAFPDSDWNLDTAVLDAAQLERLVFEVYINDRGEVVRSRILEPTDLAEPLRLTLEGRLRQTKLSPAMRAGMAVASVRRIELSVLPALE